MASPGSNQLVMSEEFSVWKNRFKRLRFKLLIILSVVGPGIITATVNNDSGGIATYSLAGAWFGYDMLWIILPITILLIASMELSARLGAVTGQGLADLFRERFGVKVTFWILLMVLVANFGTVVSEFSGIASSIEIFGSAIGHPDVFHFLKYLLIPLLTWGIWRVITEYDYIKIEKFFFVSIFFYISYPISAYLAGPDWGEAIKSLFVPNFQRIMHYDSRYLLTLVGVIGTTVTPWMQFYLQSTLIEKGINTKSLKLAKWDVIFGCLSTDVMLFCMIVACAMTLKFHPDAPIVSNVDDIGRSLVPLAGQYSGLLFAFGLFNASLFGAAILPLSTSFAICEGMGWERGMNKTYEEAPIFYWIFLSLLISGSILVLFPRADHLYLFIMRLSQVAQGIILPPFLFYLVRLGDDKRLLGEYVNPRWLSVILWICVLVLTIIDIVLLASTIMGV